MYYGYVYKFTLVPTGLIYVGKRISSVFDESYWGSGSNWAKEIARFAPTPKYKLIKREVLAWANSNYELNELEEYWIDKLGARNYNIGYNIAPGGQGGGSRDCIWYNDGINEFYVYKENLDKIDSSWVQGRLFNHSVNKGHVWVNDGTEQTHCLLDEAMNYINAGWEFGMLYRGDEWAVNASTHLQTEECSKNRNESIRKFHSEHPDFRNDGMFKKGDIPHNKNKIWITNGITNSYIDKDECIPSGWRKGCTQKRNKMEADRC